MSIYVLPDGSFRTDTVEEAVELSRRLSGATVTTSASLAGRILARMREDPDGNFSIQELALDLEVDRNFVAGELSRMVRNRKICRLGRGRYGLLPGRSPG